MKKLVVFILSALLLLSLTSCSEPEPERIEAIPVASAVCEDGRIVVTYQDGLVLDLGEVNSLLPVCSSVMKAGMASKEDQGQVKAAAEDETDRGDEGTVTDHVILDSMHYRMVTAVVAPASPNLSACLFADAATSFARYGVSAQFFGRTLTSSLGGGGIAFRPALNGSMAFAGIATSDQFYYYEGTGALADGSYAFVINGVPGGTGMVGGLQGDSMVQYTVSGSGALMPDAYILINDGIYAPVDDAVLPLLRQHATAVTVPETYRNMAVTVIEKDAFRDFSALTSVSIPKTITSIEENAFAGCSALTELRFAGTQAEWDAVEKAAGWNDGREFTVICAAEGVD